MIRACSLAAVLLGATLLSASAIPARARPFTAMDLVTLDRVSGPVVSPDAGMVAFSLRSTDLAHDRGVNGVRLLSLVAPDATPVVLAGAESDARDPFWAPDGRAVYVLSGRSGSDQVWRLPVSGGMPVQVTRLPEDVGSFRVSPDGRHLLVSVAVFPGSESPAETAARRHAPGGVRHDGMVFDRLFVRHWDRWADGTRDHLFALALDAAGVATGTPVPLMRGLDGDVPSRPFGDPDDYAVSPDGKTVFFSVRVAGRTEPWSTDFDIYSVPMDGTTPARNLTASNPAWDAGPVVSPDGTRLAFRAMKRPGFEADRFGVMVMDLDSGRSREIAPDWDRSAQSLFWSRDGRTLFATAEEAGQDKLFALDVAGGHVAALTQDGRVAAAVPAGADIVVQHDALDGPAELWRLPAAGGPLRPLTHVDAARLAGVEMAPATRFAFKGWNNETVQGYVVKPDGFRPGRRYPVAFLIHGGPQGSFGNDWSYRWNPQFYAGLGFAAVMIDFHGSTGYGQRFTDAISGHWGDRPLEDLQKGWAAALGQFPFLDGSRACALGASYGGFMVNWIAGTWNRPWKCLVTHDGVFEDRMMGFSTEELWFSEWEHGGPGHTPWSDPAAYARFDPSAHVADWRVPQLVIHGGRDFRIPLEQGLGAFDALQRRGIESRLLVFPDENHWVLKPGNSLQWHQVVADWLRLHAGTPED